MTVVAPSPASDVFIGPARLGDILPLRQLFKLALQIDFQYFPAGYAAEISAQNSLVHLALGRWRQDCVMLVARRGGRLIGYAIGSLTPQGRGELYWLYVDRAERRRKVGVRLLRATVAELQRRGAARITLVTYDLKDYYQHQGFAYQGKQHIHGVDLDVMEYPGNGQETTAKAA